MLGLGFRRFARLVVDVCRAVLCLQIDAGSLQRASVESPETVGAQDVGAEGDGGERGPEEDSQEGLR
jgi:hypothetical protein